MTIPAEATYVSFTGDGTTVAFSYNKRVYDGASLKVYTYDAASDTVPQLVDSGDYTVAVESDYSGATVTFDTAPASGVKVGILREIDLTQTVDIGDTEYVKPSDLEKALDRDVMMAQQTAQTAGRALSTDPFDFTLTARADKYLGFDGDGAIEYKDNPFLSGAGAPASTLGSLGAFYIDTTNNLFYGPKTGSGWGTGTNIRGDDGTDGTNGTNGTDGADGADGTNGTDGNTVLSGTAAPGSSDGVDGDYFIDHTALKIYGPKASGAWPAGVNIKGDKGDTGDAGADGTNGTNGTNGTDGADGADGNTILSGTAAPTSGDGVDGDYWIDHTAEKIYGPKASGAWPAGVNIKGDKGDTGDTGPAGSGTGDMLATTYDPNGVAADAFDMANMVEATDAKVMTAAERTKLTGIESGATADQTAAEILTALKTVDGTGTGLDADLLDGNEASAFATAAQGAKADTATQPGDLGTAAAADTGDFATAAQGTKADAAAAKASNLSDLGNVLTARTNLKIVTCDQATYDGLTPDSDTLYFVTA